MGDLDRHLLVFGKLKFPRGGVPRWRALAFPGPNPDWPDVLEGGHLPPSDVGAAVDAIAGMGASNGDVGVYARGATVTLCGFLLEPGTRDWSRDVGAVLQRAADVGAAGEVVFLRVSGDGGARLIVGDGGSRFEDLEPDDGLALLETTPAQEACGRYDFTTTPSAPIPLEQEVPAELTDAVAQAVAAMPDAPPQDLCSPMGVALAFEALVVGRSAAVPTIALAVFRAGYDGTLATMAGAALNGSGDPAVLDALLAYAAPPTGPAPLLLADLASIFRKPVLYEILGSLRAPGATERIAERFDLVVSRADRDGDNALARLTGALMVRGALDDARATAVANRLPDQFGALRPAPPPS